MSQKIAVYGSLREGCYNFDRMANYFGEGSIKKLLKTSLKGYAIYALNKHYPGVKETHQTDEIVVDILEVSDEAYKGIRAMEIGAGYSEKKITVEGHECVIYLYDGAVNNFDKVLSGDWLEKAKTEYRIKNLYE